MKTTTWALYLAILVIGVGCSSTSHIVTGEARAPISPEQVRVFSAPPKKFQEIAILNVESAGWTSQGETDRAIQELKKEAAELGANGVLLVKRGTASSGVYGTVNPKTGTFSAVESNYTTMEARAIFVIEE